MKYCSNYESGQLPSLPCSQSTLLRFNNSLSTYSVPKKVSRVFIDTLSFNSPNNLVRNSYYSHFWDTELNTEDWENSPRCKGIVESVSNFGLLLKPMLPLIQLKAHFMSWVFMCLFPPQTCPGPISRATICQRLPAQCLDTHQIQTVKRNEDR